MMRCFGCLQTIFPGEEIHLVDLENDAGSTATLVYHKECRMKEKEKEKDAD